MLETSDYLQALARETNRPEEAVLAEALRTGLREMWRQRILGLYLKGEIDRAAVVDQVGIDAVEVAERQYQAMQEDLARAKKPS
jgi:hypothetical protein